MSGIALLLLGLLPPALDEPRNGEVWRLFRGLHSSGRIEMRVVSGSAERAAQRLAERITEDGEFEASVNPEESDPSAVRVFAGTLADFRLQAMAGRLGVTALEEGFHLLGREYRSPADALVAVFEDPLQPGRPLCLYLANDPESLAAYLGEIPRLTRPSLRVFADGDLALDCPLDPSGKPRVELAKDYLARRAEYFARGHSATFPGITIRLRGRPDAERWKTYGLALGRVQTRVGAWLGAEGQAALPARKKKKEKVEEPPGASVESTGTAEEGSGAGEPAGPAASTSHGDADPAPESGPADGAPEDGSEEEEPEEDDDAGLSVEIFLYDHPEDLEACLGESRLVVVNPVRPRVHVLFASGLPDDGGAGYAQVLARALAGEPASPWMTDGLVVAASSRWWGVDLDEWIVRIARGGVIPEVTDLLDPRAGERWSEHSLIPARGILFRSMVEVVKGNAGKMLATWNGAPLDPERLAEFYRSGQVRARDAFKGRRGREGRSARSLPVRHGIALVEGPRFRYSARAVGEALDGLATLVPGPDAVSLTVYTSEEDPSPPTATLSPRRVRGSASDLALANACAEARARDMGVLLALEPLSRPSGSWADSLLASGLETQEEFWARYARAVVHYGLLSDLVGVEVLSLGSNLRSTSRTEPRGTVANPEALEQRRTGWRGLIQQARSAFSGGLTYAASFPEEAAEVGFFDQLDCVGLCFYPRVASPGRAPDDAELRRLLRLQLQDAIDVALRWDKPLLLVQVGFPARSEAWLEPDIPRGDLDLGAQQRYAEAFADVLAGLGESPSLRGFYLWNWPVDVGLAGPEDPGYSLRGKPAESALGRIFGR